MLTKMYNLNVSITGPAMLGVDSGGGGGNSSTGGASTLCSGATPRTPEILNTLIQMTPEYGFQAATAATSPTMSQPSQSQISQSDSHSSCSGSPLDSPVATAPSVQQTRSQLIKDSLKLSLQKKRKVSTGDSSGAESKIMKQDFDSSDDDNDTKSIRGCLTAEDEDRRRRRRERNKIAATKCRMKKRERTNNLISEAEILESQNIEFRSQVKTLEQERRSLAEMLSSHMQRCVHAERFKAPVLNVSIEKYLVDSNQSLSSQSDQLKGKLTTIKISQQKIPSVNTLKFGGRRGQRQQHHQQQQQLNHLSNATMVMTPTATTTTQSQLNGAMGVMPVDCKTSIDMGYCEGNELAMVNSMISPNGYCKPVPASECYAISSPDSGFIKSPVDIATYSNLHSAIKSDYIPNCDTSSELDLDHSQAAQLGLSIEIGSADEFILKSELNDGNDSPYTTIQSADRFLFDGTGDVTFDGDMEQQNPQNDQHHLNHDQQSIQSPYNPHHSDSIKNHIMLHNNNINNNNNSLHNNNNNSLHNNNNNNQNHMNNNVNNSSHTMIEYNSSCQTFIDTALLKEDFLNQNAEFLSIAPDGSITQFTDLDSGATSYNMTNGSGCLA